MSHLFLVDPHVLCDVRKHGRLDKVAPIAESGSSSAQFGALLLAAVNELQNLGELFFVDLWSLLGPRVEGIAQHALLGRFDRSFQKLVVDVFFYEEARSSTTTLAHVEKEGKLRLLNCFFDCKISKFSIY